MATNPDPPTADTPFGRAHQGLLLQLDGIREGKGRLFDLLIAGSGDENEINAQLAELQERNNLKLKELALLKVQAMVTVGPTADQIRDLRESVRALERMNAIAAGISGIVSATLNIAEAALYSPKPADTTMAAGDAPRAAPSAPVVDKGKLLASAAAGAAIALVAAALVTK